VKPVEIQNGLGARSARSLRVTSRFRSRRSTVLHQSPSGQIRR
jgi:hypothetical protein